MMDNGITNFIAGKWTGTEDNRTFHSVNPANTSEIIGSYARSHAKDINLAVLAARSAFPEWRSTPAPQRGTIIAKMGRLLEQNKEKLAIEMVHEMGKVLVEARGDVQEAIDMAHYMAAFGRMPDGHTVPSERPDILCYARKVPVGVVGMITPWNFPIAIPSWKMFPALLAGNTVVLKPAEDTPGLAVSFIRLLEEAGIPAGVVNLVTGYGDEAGAALVEADGVDVVSFTGSTAIGNRIMTSCGELMRRVSCELGGKNAIVVLSDADLDLAVKGALWSAFGTTGQRCTAASRLIIDRKILPSFRDTLLEQLKSMNIGSGIDPDVHIGPIINRKQLERVHQYVQTGVEEGADLLVGGSILTDSANASGCFYPPTVFDGVNSQMRIAREEIFGPVTAIMPCDGLDDALHIANSTAYGLSLSLYTRDISSAFKAVDRLDSGIVYINLPTSGAEIQLPFGGVKQTGNGHREAGVAAMDYCTEWKSVYVNYSASSELVRAQIDTQG